MIDYLLKHLPVLGLIFFFIFFVGVMIYVLRPSAKKTLQQYANIPLENSNER